MMRVKNVLPLRSYMIALEFVNGEKRVYNCYPLLQYPIFSKLKDKAYFQTVHVDEMGIVCWDDATDIEPDELYNNSESIDSILKVG